MLNVKNSFTICVFVEKMLLSPDNCVKREKTRKSAGFTWNKWPGSTHFLM
jgi:hypothetical protein